MRGASGIGILDHSGTEFGGPTEARRGASVVPAVADQLHSSLLRAENELAGEYRRRNDRYDYRSVHPADVDALLAQGWEIYRKGKTRFRIRQLKPHDKLLEDEVWSLFHRMRYPELSGRHFKIEYTRRDGTPDSKQIDVFAKNEETALVVECKSRVERGKRALTKDLAETGYLQKPIADAIRRVYGLEHKLQVIWVYVTRNIIWSDPDLARASDLNIQVVTENEFRYYDKFIRHLGPAGRYQVLAEFLRNKRIPELENVKVPAVRGRLGKHTFYSFVVPARHLLKIAFVNHQALSHPNPDRDELPAYQRMVSPGRIKEIERFIAGGGFFPTNILVNFVSGCKFDLLSNKENSAEGLRFGWLHLPSRYRSAWIIDGQHRLYGYSRLDEKFLDQSLFVLAFERMKTNVEAELFITINQKQKSVPKTIIASLKADLLWGSEEPRERVDALASALIKRVNLDASSPFYQRFSMEGLEDAEGTALTIGEVSKGLARSGLLGKVLQKNYSLGPLCGATDEETVPRARKFLNSYFALIREANPERWEQGRDGAILSNPGIRAHLLLIAEIFRYCAAKRGVDPDLCNDEELLTMVSDTIPPLLHFIKTAPDSEVRSRFSRRFGEGGVVEYHNNLCRIIHEGQPDFGTDEFRKWLAAQDQARIANANQQVIEIDRGLRDYVFRVLKRVHGEHEIPTSGEKAYWDEGIESGKIKAEAYSRQQQDPASERRPKEAYVNTIELKQIVRQSNNWSYFKDNLNIPLPGEKGKVYYLDWMDRFNQLRRIPAHPSSLRPYTKEDFEFLEWLREELDSKHDIATGG
jgi:DNA sulfur modification protein DndB